MTDIQMLLKALDENWRDESTLHALIDCYAALPGESFRTAVQFAAKHVNARMQAWEMAEAIKLKEVEEDWWNYLLMILMDEVDFREGDNPEVHLVVGSQEPSLKRRRRGVGTTKYYHGVITVGAGYLLELDWEERDRIRREKVEFDTFDVNT